MRYLRDRPARSSADTPAGGTAVSKDAGSNGSTDGGGADPTVGMPGGPGTDPVVEPDGEPDGDPHGDTPEPTSFRSTALSGGAYLAVREILGILIRVGGVVVVTRLIGPANYGIYAAASAFAALAVVASQMGIEVYLIRQPEEPTREHYDEAFTFLLVASLLCSVIAAGLAAVIGPLVHLPSHDLRVFYVLVLAVPINVLWAPAQARIERAFGYRRLAWLELGGDVIIYAVAIPLALIGAGAWSLVLGFVAWQVWLLVGSYAMAGLRPRWRWSLPAMRELLHHGMTYSAAGWVDSVAGMANPLIVGHFFGASGVGLVALAFRLVDTLGFAQRATWRLSIVALSRVQNEVDRLRRGLEEGMVLQLLATSIPIVGFCVVAPTVVPRVFGSEWSPMIPVFTTFAVARVINSPMMMTMGLLYSKGMNSVVSKASVTNAVMTFGLAIPLTAALGLWGFGLARIVCTVSWMMLRVPAQRVVTHRYGALLPWMAMLIPLALFPDVQWPLRLLLALPVLMGFLVPSVRHHGRDYLAAGWSGLLHRGAQT